MMEENFKILTANFSKILYPYREISKDQEETFVDQALAINSLISIRLARYDKIIPSIRRQALSLVDKLDGMLESLASINKFYCYYYHVLLEIIEECDLSEHNTI
jgi:hypothetical protein